MFLGKLFGSQDDKPAPRRRGAGKGPANRTVTTRKLNQKVAVDDLRVGMYVVELDIPWEESSFLLQGLEITSTADINELRKQCAHVYVDYDEFGLQNTSKGTGNANASSALGRGVDRCVEDEFSEAQEVHSLASVTLTSLFEEVRMGGEIDGGKVKQAVNGCVDSILRNPDASVWLTRMQHKNQATAQHSLNVAALSIIMGRTLGMSPQQLEDVGVCGMLHDVGKTRISSELLNKTGSLSAAEVLEMQKHTIYGRDVLASTKSVMSGAADVALCHHERPDGSGYPRRLDAEKIPQIAKIIAIAEAYDAITTQQVYRNARSPSDALQVLYAARGKQFDEELVIKFIDSVGIFPPGSIVEMLNGEIGIVLANTDDKLRPRVILILDAAKEAAPQRVVDLSRMDSDNDGEIYQIKGTHKDGSFDIDVADFQRAGLRMG